MRRQRVSDVGLILKRLLPAILLLLASASLVNSQQPLVGLIQGRIVDQNDAPVPGAALTATNVDSVEPLSRRHFTATDQKGLYQFADIPMGRFSIVVTKSGYRNYRIDEVTVRGGETVNLPDIKMSSVG